MSTSYDPERTTRAPRAEGFTSAYAWASSPLGDPTDSASNLPYEHDFPPPPIAPKTKTKRRPIDKTFVAGGVIGLLGAAAVLGMALFGNSPQPQDPAPAPASTSVPPSSTPSVVTTDSAPAPAAVVAPLPDSQPPAADPGTPPQGPVATAPAPQASVPVAPQQLPPPHSLPSPPKLAPPLPLKLPVPPKLPPLCLPPQHLVQGVCK
jgi:hypothetical protein